MEAIETTPAIACTVISVSELVPGASLDERLRAEHVMLERDRVLRSRLEVLMTSMWSRKDVARPFGPGNKVAQGLFLLTGESGSGKSKTMEAALSALKRPDGTPLRSKACVVTMPSPYSSKGLARAIIAELLGIEDVELETKTMPDSELWLTARRLLAEHRKDILVIDEGARWATVRTVGDKASDKELRILADNLNECSMFGRWPVAVLVAGLPSLKVLWNTGALGQVKRRSKPLNLPRFTPDTVSDVRLAINQFAEVAGVKVAISQRAAIERRVAHAAGQLPGVALEICREAVRLAAGGEDRRLTLKHFEKVYTLMKDCGPDENVFGIAGWANLGVNYTSNREELEQAIEQEAVEEKKKQ